MVRETGFQSQVESYQKLKNWYLMPPCLALSIITLESRVKWSNHGNGLAPLPTPRWSSYWKGGPRVTLDLGRQVYFTFFAKLRAIGYVTDFKHNTGMYFSLFSSHVMFCLMSVFLLVFCFVFPFSFFFFCRLFCFCYLSAEDTGLI